MTAALLRLYSGEYDADCCYAVVNLDQPLVQSIVARISQATSEKQRDANFVKLAWWDSSPTFLGWDETLEEACTLFQEPGIDDSVTTTSESFTGWGILATGYTPSHELVRRVECIQMVISDSEVSGRRS